MSIYLSHLYRKKNFFKSRKFYGNSVITAKKYMNSEISRSFENFIFKRNPK